MLLDWIERYFALNSWCQPSAMDTLSLWIFPCHLLMPCEVGRNRVSSQNRGRRSSCKYLWISVNIPEYGISPHRSDISLCTHTWGFRACYWGNISESQNLKIVTTPYRDRVLHFRCLNVLKYFVLKPNYPPLRRANDCIPSMNAGANIFVILNNVEYKQCPTHDHNPEEQHPWSNENSRRQWHEFQLFVDEWSPQDMGKKRHIYFISIYISIFPLWFIALMKFNLFPYWFFSWWGRDSRGHLVYQEENRKILFFAVVLLWKITTMIIFNLGKLFLLNQCKIVFISTKGALRTYRVFNCPPPLILLSVGR